MKKSFKLWFILALAVFLILGGITALAAGEYTIVGSKIQPVIQETYSYAGANIIEIKQGHKAVIWVDGSITESSAMETEIINAIKGPDTSTHGLDPSINNWPLSDVEVVWGDLLFDFNELFNSDDPQYCFEVRINTNDEEITIVKFDYDSVPREYISGDYVSHILLVNKEFGSFKVSKVVNGDNAPSGTQFDITVAFSSDSSLDDILYSGDYEDIELITSGTYAIKLLAGGYAIFTNIPLDNTTYEVTEDMSGLSSYWYGPESALTGSITGTTQVDVEVENSYDGPDYGSLKVTKEVTGDDADPDQAFEITVTFALPQVTAESVLPAVSLDDIQYSSDVDSADLALTENPDGTYTFYLKDGESIRFYNIPMDVTYEITEYTDDLQDGWDNTNDEEELSGTIGSTTEQTVTVVNNFDEPEYGSLEVIKNVTEGDTNKRFAITVEFSQPQYTVSAASLIGGIEYLSDVPALDLNFTDNQDGSYTFYLKHGELVTFTNIPFGTYYVVTEDLTGETNWEGQVVYPTQDQVHVINSGVLQTVNVNNDYDTPPEYGSLRVVKNVETGASTTEEFAITVQFSGSGADLEEILYNVEDTNISQNSPVWGEDTLTFYLSLHDEEYVDFTNIPINVEQYVEYAVSEELTSDQIADEWDGPNEDATGSIESTTRQTVTVYNEIGGGGGSDPKYGSLKVIKNVSGDGASDTETFDITVTFDGSTSQLNKIHFSDGATESDGIYELSLSDDEYVIFSNIPMGVGYTVSEDLTSDQEDAGWTGPDEDETGSIRSTAQQLVTVENNYYYEDDEDDEDDEEEESGVLGESEKIDPELPETGGVSTSMWLILIGLLLVAIGAAVGLKKKHSAQ